MRIFLLIALLIALIAVIFALQNTQVVSINFLAWTFQSSIALEMIITLIAGVLVGFLAMLPSSIRSQLQISNRKKEKTGLEASLAQAQQQVAALQKQLDKRFPATAKPADAKPADAKLAALLTTLRAKPAPGTPSFTHAEGRLTGIENALESADVAPTAEQHATIARAKAELAAAEKAWDAEQAGPLAALNAALAAKGEKPLTIPPLDKAKAEAPDPGQDLP